MDNGLSLMAMPPDLDAAFRKFIPPFGAAGNPVDITGGEPPITYINTVKLGLSDDRIHSLILGYWHTIVTPPMVFARNMVEVKKEMEAKGFVKPIVASLAGDVEVEEAAEYLYQNGIPAYAYSTEMPVEVLGAKYKWARARLCDCSDTLSGKMALLRDDRARARLLRMRSETLTVRQREDTRLSRNQEARRDRDERNVVRRSPRETDRA